MKRALTVLITCLTIFTLLPTTHAGAAAPATDATPGRSPEVTEPFAGDSLCVPGNYIQQPANCLPLGPSTVITDLARKGLTIPQRPLPAYGPDPELSKVPLNFAKVDIPSSARAALYANLDDAVNGTNAVGYINAGALIYVSYTTRVDRNGGHFLLLRSGQWVRASPSGYINFQGLLFTQNPSNSFGWIVETGKPRQTPTYKSPELNKSYARGTVVQIYDTKVADGVTWYMIDFDQWIERRYIRQFVTNYNPPQGAETNRWIEVNLYEQTLGVYENGRLLFATLIASGLKPFYTQPGLFKIYKKKPTETMTGAFEANRSDYYYLEDVPWTMYFDEARALHGAYWRAMFGYPQSHGCVNLSIGDARYIYDWAKEGDYVWVQDPSGETPTDTSKYGKGGA